MEELSPPSQKPDPLDYTAVRVNDEEEQSRSDDGSTTTASFVTAQQQQQQRPLIPWYNKTLFPDDAVVLWRRVVLIEHTIVVKLLKFVILTYLSLVMMFHVVRYFDWEHDRNLHLNDLWTYESNSILADIFIFYFVSRLYQRRGTDSLEFVGTLLLANWYGSVVTDFKMFRHSFTLYEMHCRWPLSLFVFCLLAIPLLIVIVILHVRHWLQNGALVARTVEWLCCVLFILLPYATSPYFHLHHWFAGWFIGMIFSIDQWWSRLPLAWCWGLYVNGIAVYGRDPVLTCGYSYYMSETQRCPYLKCYVEGVQEHNHTVHEMNPPDWRNCSADAYHP